MQLTVQIPDNKIDFFTELVTNLGFKVSAKQPDVLTQQQIDLAIVEHNKITSEPGHFTDWDEARKSLKIA